MNIEELVKMANDIGAYFSSEPDQQTAIDGVAGHIKRFWDPRMRSQIIAHCEESGLGMTDLVREAVQTLEPPQQKSA